MALNEAVGHIELSTHAAHFIFKEPLQRFAQFEVHFLGQSAHIVVAFNHLSGNVEALDAVGIDGALRQPFGIGNFLCFSVKHLHKVATNNFSLLLGVGHAFQVGEKFFRSIHANHIQPQSLIIAKHLAEFIFAKHTVVHKNASKVAANGLVEQHTQHTRIHAARQSENHAVASQLSPQFGDGGVHKRSRAPLLPAAANVYHKVAQQLRALQRVKHLRVELHRPHRRRSRRIGGIFHIGSGSNHPAIRRNSRNGIAMAHPHLRMRLKALQKRILGIKFLEVGTPVFARIGFLHLAAQSVRHKLRTIANAQHRHLAQKLTQIHFKRLRIVHRKRRTRKNHANHRIVAHRKLIVGQNFAKRVKFANASTNQLSGLRTEIQDNNFLLHGKGLGGYD